MKHLLAGFLLAFALAAPAAADGLSKRAPAHDQGMPAISWTGYHIGLQAGVGFWGTEHLFTGGIASGDFEFSNGFIGASWGSTWQRGSLVYGFDSDFSFTDSSAESPGPGCGAGTCSTDVRYFGTSRVRVGHAKDRMLVYATGGLAYARVEAGNTTDSGTKTRYGWTLGAGIEWMLAPRWSMKLEYQHLEFDDSRNYSSGGSGVGVDLDADIVRAGVNYRFDLPFLRRF